MIYEIQDIDTLFRDVIAKVKPSDDFDENVKKGLQEIEQLLDSSDVRHHVKGICAFFPDKDYHLTTMYIGLTLCLCCGMCETLSSHFVRCGTRYTVGNVCETTDDNMIHEFMLKLYRETGMRLIGDDSTLHKNVCRVSIANFAQTYRLESKLRGFTRIWEFPILMKDDKYSTAIVFVPILRP